jgi:Lon protease-like protein
MAEHRSLKELPDIIPAFPLPGALLLPRGQMPLNIFEPRYLSMVDDALAGARIIGMIQPNSAAIQQLGPPALYEVGCAGRITQFAETDDGRYLITLSGVCRFRAREELTVLTPYRQLRVDFGAFRHDLTPRDGEEAVDRDAVLRALRDFSNANAVEIDWDNVRQAPNEPLVNALAMMAPYGEKEKQALLEAPDLKTRAEILVAITEMELARDGSDPETPIQ